MFLTRLSQADAILCCWIFKRPAYVVDDLTGNGVIQAGQTEEDYIDEGLGYAS